VPVNPIIRTIARNLSHEYSHARDNITEDEMAGHAAFLKEMLGARYNVAKNPEGERRSKR
jgi:hypothetical protein